MMRSLLTGLAALALAAGAAAQFDGPAPLAWRWYQSSAVSPTAAPIVMGDTVYYSLGSRVYCLDRYSGNMRWRFPLVDPIEGAFRSAPVVFGDTLIVAGDNQIIYGVNPTTGDLKWTFNAPGKIVSQPILVGNLLIAAQADNKLIAIYPDTGKDAWEKEGPLSVFDGIVGGLAANDSDVLVFTGKSALLSINVGTRKTTWQRGFGQLDPSVTPLVSSGTIYVPSGPFLTAINATNGKPRWQSDSHQTQLVFMPALSPDSIFTVSQDGHAVAFDFKGKITTKTPIDLGSFPLTSPTYVGGKFVVLTANGAVNLVDPSYIAPTDQATPTTTKKSNWDDRIDVVMPGQRIEAPSKDLLWSFVIRPMGDTTQTNNQNPGTSGPGRGNGGTFGGAGRGGNNQNNNNNTPITFVQAAAPAVLDGQTLLVAAKDGSLLAFDKDLGVDLTPPTVKMVWPNSGDQVSSQPNLELIFKIDDEATGVNVRSLTIASDGQPLDYSYSRDGYATVRISALGKNKPFTNGRKLITVTVSDWYGNKAQQPFSLYIDNSLRPLVRPDSQGNQPGRGPGRGGFGGGMGGPGGGQGGLGGGLGN